MSYRLGPATTFLVASKQPEATQENISTRSDQAFRFLDLPAELRNMVYAYCEESFQFDCQEGVNWIRHIQLRSRIRGGYPDQFEVEYGLKYFNLPRV